MFRKTISVIAALFASSAQARVNTQFQEYLSGAKPINHEVFVEMWNYFE